MSVEAAPARLCRVETGTSAQMLAKIIRVLFPDAETVADLTFGSGAFWKPAPAHLAVTGVDLDPARAPHVVADFTRLPFSDASFDLCVFDPPYITETGAGSLIGRRFGSYPSTPSMRASVEAGAREAWRVARIGVVVKVMDYCHASRLVRMGRWVEDAIPAELYDVAYLASRAKVEDRKWSRRGSQLSVRSTATTWLVWRRDGAIHKRRAVPMLLEAR